MAKTDFKSVEDYITSQPEAVQGILGRVRSAIRKAVPLAREVISYQMPTYTLNGGRLLYFAVWKQHYSIYAAAEQVVAAFQEELARYEVEHNPLPALRARPREVDWTNREIPRERGRRQREGESGREEESLGLVDPPSRRLVTLAAPHHAILVASPCSIPSNSTFPAPFVHTFWCATVSTWR